MVIWTRSLSNFHIISLTSFLLPGIDKTVPPSNLKVDLSCTLRRQTEVLPSTKKNFKKMPNSPVIISEKSEMCQIHLWLVANLWLFTCDWLPAVGVVHNISEARGVNLREGNYWKFKHTRRVPQLTCIWLSGLPGASGLGNHTKAHMLFVFPMSILEKANIDNLEHLCWWSFQKQFWFWACALFVVGMLNWNIPKQKEKVIDHKVFTKL